MPKTYVALVNSSWGVGLTPDSAARLAISEAKQFAKPFGGIRKDYTIDMRVYGIRDGCYFYMDERGVFEVDRKTDRIVAYAKVDTVYKDVHPQLPLNKIELNEGDTSDVYPYGEGCVDEVNEKGAPPIGEKVEQPCPADP